MTINKLAVKALKQDIKSSYETYYFNLNDEKKEQYYWFWRGQIDAWVAAWSLCQEDEREVLDYLVSVFYEKRKYGLFNKKEGYFLR